MEEREPYSSETGRTRTRLEDVKRRGGRAEYAFNPGEELEGRPPIFYVPTQLVTTIEHANLVHRLLEEWHGKCGRPQPLLEYNNDIVVFTVEGDSLHIAAAIKRAVAKMAWGPNDLPIAPLHVLTPAPQPKIGPGDDPIPALPGDRAPKGPPVEPQAPVVIVDTGLWTEPPNGIVATIAPGGEEKVDAEPKDGFVDFYGSGHGGFIAGVVQNNAPGAGVIAHNAFGENGLTEATVINQVDAALAKTDLMVLNLSLGTYEINDDGCSRIELVALRSAMRRWRDKHPGALIVAAAGNDSASDPFFPAGFAGEPEFADMVVSVGALSAAPRRAGIHSAAAGFSNFGPWVTAWAPGEHIVSEYPDDIKFAYHDATGSIVGSAVFEAGLASWSGTSFAAPFVAAEIVREMRQGESPRATWARLRAGSPFVIFWPSW